MDILDDLLMKMISYNSGDPKRIQHLIKVHSFARLIGLSENHTYSDVDGLDYQILLEADFLVNLFEEGLEPEAADAAYHNIFRTETGKRICEEMFF